MTKNPLLADRDDRIAASQNRRSAEDMRLACWDRNLRAKDHGWCRWELVRDVQRTGYMGWEIAVIDGHDAEEIWAMLDDKPLVYVNWTEANTRQLHGLVRWRMERGMSPDALMVWLGEGRRERRANWVLQQTGAPHPEREATQADMMDF